MKPLPERVLLYATPEHACSYVAERRAVTVFVDPHCPKGPSLYGQLSGLGFRRSGEHIYRPRCPDCDACVALRIPVDEFRPRRRHRRNWRANRDLEVRLVEPVYRAEHFDLYERYLSARHPGGGMDDPTPEQFMNFLTSPWSETDFVEIRAGDRLLGVAVMDRFEGGLSAVYTFFDPAEAGRGLGVYSVLWQIRHARRLGIRWLYLGYLIEACDKMSYKSEYRPHERLLEGHWVRQS